jgi:hypothetical protein
VDDLIKAMHNDEVVFVTMTNTTGNPWAKKGQSAAGVTFQVFLEVIAFACFIASIYKLHFFISKSGIQASVGQLCLSFEIIASLSKLS